MSKQVMNISAIVFTAPDQVNIEALKLPTCGPNHVIAETIYTLVSPGTELRILSGIKESKGKFPLKRMIA